MLFFFFFNDTATTEIYTLSLHDALPISGMGSVPVLMEMVRLVTALSTGRRFVTVKLADRKSTRLNSSHGYISYAVFCLKKKKKKNKISDHARWSEGSDSVEPRQHDGCVV